MSPVGSFLYSNSFLFFDASWIVLVGHVHSDRCLDSVELPKGVALDIMLSSLG